MSPVRSPSALGDPKRPSSALPAARRTGEKLSSNSKFSFSSNSNFSSSAPSMLIPLRDETKRLAFCAPSKLNDLPAPSHLLAQSHKGSWAASRLSQNWFDEVEEDEQQHPASCRDNHRSGVVFLALSTPPKIVEASREWQDLMQIDKAACLGRTLKLITGPETDLHLLDSLVQCTQTRGWLSLYPPKTGRKVLCGLRAQLVEQTRARTTYAPSVCRLTVSPCTHALDEKAVVADEQSSLVLVKAAKPHHVVYASPRFCEAYGFGRHKIVGRTAQVLLGPTSDVGRWDEALEQVYFVHATFSLCGRALSMRNCSA